MGRRVEPGAPDPLGARWDGRGINFALYSSHAARVELCLFEGEREAERVPLPERTGDVWHGYLPGLGAGTRYGYRVHGPYAPEHGHRFNPNKLLVDPHARALDGELRSSNALHGYRLDDNGHEIGADERDSAPYVPKCVAVDPAFDWGNDRAPRIPWPETVIYEAHVRGFTQLHPAVPDALRGTFAGLAHDPVVDYLRALGITCIELMPVHAFVDDDFLVRQGLRNYWGYNSLAFFAPEPRYLAGAGIGAFKQLVRRLHDAGIEVVLDVVYNHSAEGGRLGPTLSLRGIDNAAYYRLRADDPREYVNDTGCGNTLAVERPAVRRMVLASLRYWVEEMHVDGFRFDLATALARGADGFDPRASLFTEIQADPVLGSVKLIAEPWDVGPQGYRLGGFPPGWAEWNDRFRDTLRRFWRGDPGQLPELARRLHGSSDLFDRAGRAPWASINYVASHDGFTLADVASYGRRHNHANGESNRDGHGSNFSDNMGVEGPSDDPALQARRCRRRRNLLASALLAQGTPMLLAGDELGRTQRGNNNAYCQDNETSWLDWSRLEQGANFLAFTRELIALRHRYPVLRRARFVHGDTVDEVTGLSDVAWFAPSGHPMSEQAWEDPDRRSLAMLLGPTAAEGSGPARESGAVMIVLNGHREPVEFELPTDTTVRAWRCLLSTPENRPTAELSSLATEPESIYVLVAVLRDPLS